MGTRHLTVDAAAADFGRRMFKYLFQEFVEGSFEVEVHPIIEHDAVQCGLVEKAVYDPDKHGDIDDVEPGDDVWIITDLGKEVRIS